MLKLPKLLLMLPVAALLAGCQYDVLVPKGWVAAQERDLFVISTLIMCIVIVPVLIMSVYFPWKYRASRQDKSDYDPHFEHSTKIEIVVWGVPIAIIVALGWFVYEYTHKLDPYRPLPAEVAQGKPVEVEAVSLDWKWLFIYPEYGVASVNEMVIPANRPINMKLTSSTVMSTFVVPSLSGMIYTMTGMQTKLHIVADHQGTYPGRAAHYNGPGFTGMTFDTIATDDAGFDAWIAKAKASGKELDTESYMSLEKPSMRDPVGYYASVEPDLFNRIVNMCVEPGKTCMAETMMQDRMGGGGLDGIKDKSKLEYDDARGVDGFGNALPTPPAPLAHLLSGGHGAAGEEEGQTHGE